MQNQAVDTNEVLASWSDASGESACHLEFASEHWQSDIAGAPSGHPTPHEILDAALASCTALTLQLYVKHKGWAVGRVDVTVSHEHVQGVYRMALQIGVEGELSAEQRAALLRVAQACPVHKTLMGDIAIDTAPVAA